MDLVEVQHSSELFQAQFHVYNHIFSYISSMSFKCAVQLNIPNIIHSHGQPITLPELVSALKIHPTKTAFIHRLMRLLVHLSFFTKIRRNQEQEDSYDLTTSSRILLKDKTSSFSPFVILMLEHDFMTPWHLLADWFRKDEATTTPFELEKVMKFWEYQVESKRFRDLFNSGKMNLVIKGCDAIFEGINSLVNVGKNGSEDHRGGIPSCETILDVP